jgi:hypothetical protein
MNVMLFPDPRLRSPTALGDAASDLEAYNASPVSAVVGLTVNGLFAAVSWYLWKHKHPVWAALFGLSAVGGAGYNIYKLTQGRQATMSSYGLTDVYAEPCDLSRDLSALSDALEQVNALGLYNAPIAIAAQALYDANSQMSVSRTDCARVTAGLRGMTTQLQRFVQQNMPSGDVGTTPYTEPSRLPVWVLPVAIGGGALLVLGAVGAAAARGARRKTAGYRRKHQ